MLIGYGNDLKEEDYLARKRKEHNEKEAALGDQWVTTWFDARHKTYEPLFNELLLKFGKLKAVADAPCTAIVKTKRTEPGWNAGIPIG